MLFTILINAPYLPFATALLISLKNDSGVFCHVSWCVFLYESAFSCAVCVGVRLCYKVTYVLWCYVMFYVFNF